MFACATTTLRLDKQSCDTWSWKYILQGHGMLSLSLALCLTRSLNRWHLFSLRNKNVYSNQNRFQWVLMWKKRVRSLYTIPMIICLYLFFFFYFARDLVRFYHLFACKSTEYIWNVTVFQMWFSTLCVRAREKESVC